MSKVKVSGAVLAAVVGLMFANQPLFAQDNPSQPATVKCVGANSCKGQSACASALNSCKGQNSCKGKGWITTTSADCTQKGGQIDKSES
ncbi:MAG TPA: hypothetical protein VMF50_08040 [Candidatus Binataceae bacterium]|nr:hypothetical protein [Candidatus Binataceae bacterium]